MKIYLGLLASGEGVGEAEELLFLFVSRIDSMALLCHHSNLMPRGSKIIAFVIFKLTNFDGKCKRTETGDDSDREA